MPAMRRPVKLPSSVRAWARLLLCLALFAAQPAAGFGVEGHRIVGLIAEQHLCAGAPGWLAPLLEGETLADAGIWADIIRDYPRWKHTGPWHYINVADRGSMTRAMAASPDNVLAAIQRAEGELADKRRSVTQRAQALRFLVHFIADIHQPLHVGRAGDRGGNDIELRWGRQRLNLHALWDGQALLRERGVSTEQLARAIGALAVGQADRWQRVEPLHWAEESRAYRPLIYRLPEPEPVAAGSGAIAEGYGDPADKVKSMQSVRDRGAALPLIPLDAAYRVMARDILHLRLAQAGVRVATRINRLACPAGGPSASRQSGQAVESPSPTH
jgi:hypothetical protein